MSQELIKGQSQVQAFRCTYPKCENIGEIQWRRELLCRRCFKRINSIAAAFQGNSESINKASLEVDNG